MTNFKRFMMMIVAIATLSLNSCKKDNFDEPPTETVDPNIPVTHTIRQLKDLFGGSSLKLTDDIVISGIVVANDKSGNIFNQIIIDDGTAGISVAIDQNALFGEFPVGRKVYVKCKDLYLAASNNLLGIYGALDITGSTVEIPAGLITKYIVKANTGNPVVPIEIDNIARLNDSFQNRLIKITEAEFENSSSNKPYADAVNKKSVSRILKQCNGISLTGSIEVRSSGYADFATKLTPRGKGTIIGIYTVFGTAKQLILRDGAETDMNGIKCDGSGLDVITHVNEDFESTSTSASSLSLTGWVNYYVTGEGTKKWKTSNQSGSKMASMTAFGSPNENVNIAWLITPSFDLTATVNDTFSFVYTDKFSNPAILDVLYSTNYSGSGDPSSATWTAIPGVIINSGNNETLIESGKISLNDINANNVNIAFRYTGGYAAPQKTSNYYIDNVKVIGKTP